MIVEERIYTLHPGKVPEMVKLYGEEGLPLQQNYLGKFIGYFTTETGNLNQVVFMWGYESLDDRAARRERNREGSGVAGLFLKKCSRSS